MLEVDYTATRGEEGEREFAYVKIEESWTGYTQLRWLASLSTGKRWDY